MRLIPRSISLATLAALALGSSACAEVYEPRPSDAVVITGNSLGGYRVYRHGENLGSEWAIRDAVDGDPRAEAEADTAISERVGSAATGIIGAIALGVGAGLVTDQATSQNAFPSTLGDAGLALVLGGAALLITGSFLASAAHTHTFNAANMFNDDMSGRGVRGPSEPVYEPPPTSSLAGTHVAVYITPGPGYAPRPVDAAPVVPR
jgi:hypothetical protein